MSAVAIPKSNSSAISQRQVPFFPYPALAKSYEQEFLDSIRDVMTRGAYILQKDLQQFEQDLAAYHNVRYAIGVADGTNAITLLLRAANIGAGDEVLLPSHTYVATAAAVHDVGATPILVDCGADHLIDPQAVRQAITARSKAILPVHLNGRICDMAALTEIANEYQLSIIEDGAQAFGARFHGLCLGSFDLGGTLSFYPAKILGCFGDGGAVLTNNQTVYERISSSRDHGRSASGEFIGWGTNSRLDNLQAAILLVRLRHIDTEITRRRAIARRYQQGLAQLGAVTLPPGPDADSLRFDTFQNYEIQAEQRDELKSYLEAQGVRTLVQWGGKAVHQLAPLGFSCTLPKTEALFTRCLLLPMNPYLSDEDVEQVISTIVDFYAAC